jgi:hypothetical protein
LSQSLRLKSSEAWKAPLDAAPDKAKIAKSAATPGPFTVSINPLATAANSTPDPSSHTLGSNTRLVVRTARHHVPLQSHVLGAAACGGANISNSFGYIVRPQNAPFSTGCNNIALQPVPLGFPADVSSFRQVQRGDLRAGVDGFACRCRPPASRRLASPSLPCSCVLPLEAVEETLRRRRFLARCSNACTECL